MGYGVASTRDYRKMGCRYQVCGYLYTIRLLLICFTSVFDSDGEFLLIEAAEELPSWVTPTNAENRARSWQFHPYGLLTRVSIGLDP